LAEKLKEFEAAGFVVKDGQKSIHEESSIRFMREVIGMSKWHEEVLSNGLSLDLKDILRRYREKNNVSALKNMEVLKEKVKEWEDDGYVFQTLHVSNLFFFRSVNMYTCCIVLFLASQIDIFGEASTQCSTVS
jgi:hypothetical protein